ncbi:glycosyltransferase [Otoolea muris]|uniref:glycosyltransferase n=1 Tax=Otoolea muris TaxID=2941515 RepID=UPI00203C946B|nr:glycosyltransferase family 2 protein [Otoolea muris]
MTDAANQLAIIVLNYQEYEISQKCVSGLLSIGVKNPIVIVDNASLNASYEKLKDRFSGNGQVTVVRSERNGGYSYGNNYGIHTAEQTNQLKYICIMNPDVTLEQNFLEDLCRSLSLHSEYAAISALMFQGRRFETDKISWPVPDDRSLYKSHSLFNRACHQTCGYDVLEGGLIRTETVPGSFFVIKYDVFKAAGFFDENVFLYNEENILGLKLKKMGYNCVIDTSHYYLHNHAETSREKVIYRYKHEFDKILRDYEYRYLSRKYLCEAYYAHKNIGKLWLVHVSNLLALYIKRYYILFRYRKSSDKKRIRRL